MGDETAPQVLVIDDDADVGEAVGDLLLLGGYRSVLAASGDEALELLRHGAFRLVLLDWRLPEEPSGFELVRRLRELGGEIPIVVLSADPISLEEARAAEITGCLGKPFDYHALLAIVAAHAGPASDGAAPSADHPRGNP